MSDQPREFLLAHPDEQDGLTPEMEPGAVPERYLNRYHAEYDVRCAFCPSHTPHRRGFTVEMADGRIALCGIDCATKYFGAEVAARHEADLEKEIKKQSKKRLVLRALTGIEYVLDQLNQKWLKIENEAAHASSIISSVFHHSSISQMINDRGDIEIIENSPRWVEDFDSDVPFATRPVYEVRCVCKIKCARVIFSGVSNFARAKDALGKMKSMAERSNLTDKELEELAHLRLRAISFLEQGVKFLDASHVFFTRKNIKELEKLRQRVASSAEKLNGKIGLPGSLLLSYLMNFQLSPQEFLIYLSGQR